ncbi:MAG TPA: XrtA/PEP-CTERM system TPR-repeat protein PrsT [Rhizomicrobium sp.]|nr:XrtA/PEP-CTERM system TPR-repeat protein PrsT [Rhizomicrobium sp.]
MRKCPARHHRRERPVQWGGRTRIAAAFLGVAALALGGAVARADEASPYLDSAHKLEKAHDLRGAEIQLRNAAQVAPASGAIRVELAQVYLRLHDPNAAEAELFAAHLRGAPDEATAPLMAQAMLEMGEFGDLLRSVPAGNRAPKTESLVRGYRGMAELGLGETDRARAMFADAERLDPKSPQPLIGETRLLMQEHQLDQAAQKIDRALTLDPGDADALDTKGLVLALRGDAPGALRQYAAALAVDPANLRAMLDRADLETERGNLEAAQKDLAAIRNLAPTSMMAAYLQATIDAARGQLKSADALIEKIRGAMSSFPPAYLVAAEVKFELNQLDQAEDFARKFIAQAGDQPKAYQLLGAIALKRGNLEAGIAALEKAAQLAPADANVLAALGQAYVAHGDMDKARAAFAQAAASAPGNGAIAAERALTDFATGDREASVAALGEVFKGGKGSLMAGPPLVIEALQIGELDVAEAAARQLLARDPGNASYQELLAAVRISRHDYAGAEMLLRGLLAKQPDLVSARRDLAQLYLTTNREAAAKNLYQDRLRANPNDVESLEALADIAFRDRNDSAAIALLVRAQNAIPADPRPSLRILAILDARKKWPEAIGRARALAAGFRGDASVADMLARLYFDAGNRVASAAAYKSAIARFPRYAPLFAHDAAVMASGKDYAGAAASALRAAQLDPRDAGLKRFYVSFAYLAKGTDAALAASETVTGDKSGPAAPLLAADVLEANNNRAGAISLLEKRQAQFPAGPVAVKLAALYQRDNRLDKALALLEAWTTAHPGDVKARSVLAEEDSTAGKLDQALLQYEWLVTQRPDNPIILNNLAWLYDWKHDPRARATAEKAIQLAPASGSAADTLGWILEERGDTVGAAKYLALASANAPADATIQYHYAVVLSKSGKADQARDVLEKLISLKNIRADTKSEAQLLLAKLGGAAGNNSHAGTQSHRVDKL